MCLASRENGKPAWPPLVTVTLIRVGNARGRPGADPYLITQQNWPKVVAAQRWDQGCSQTHPFGSILSTETGPSLGAIV